MDRDVVQQPTTRASFHFLFFYMTAVFNQAEALKQNTANIETNNKTQRSLPLIKRQLCASSGS